jgi:hypothetical protein
MPYKDPERKKEWERLHRSERLARRRQLRQIEAVEQQPQPKPAKVEFGNSVFIIPIIAGGALAAYSPKLGFAVGGLTLASSAIFKKGWAWWLVGASFSFWLCFSIRGIDRIQKQIQRNKHESWVGRNGST